MKSPWKWKQHGQCGKWISDLVPHIWLVRGRHRLPALRWSRSRTCTARPRSCRTPASCCPGFPSMGAWVSYGLGSLNENLPTFVVLPDSRGFAPNGPANWGAGFLPAAHQGTMVRAGTTQPDPRPVPARRAEVHHAGQRDATGWTLLQQAQPRAHRASRAGRLAARRAHRVVRAGRPAAAERAGGARPFAARPQATRTLYGLDEPVTEDFGRNCLIARRLLERGVRFVQVWSGADNGFPRRNWDCTRTSPATTATWARAWTSPPRRCIKDLKAARHARRHDRPLDDRVRPDAVQPGQQGPRPQPVHLHAAGWPAAASRAASPTARATSGRTRPPTSPTYCYDLHATVLHLLGIDHERLTFRHNGIDRRLTDVHGHVIGEIIA